MPNCEKLISPTFFLKKFAFCKTKYMIKQQSGFLL